MKIGIDIDNTIAPTFKTIIEYLNKKYSSKKRHKHSKNPSGYDLFHSDFKTFYPDWKEFIESDSHHAMKPIKGSVRVISKLSKKHEIYVLTARASYQRVSTVFWIDKHYKNKFEEILFLDYHNDDNTKPVFTKGDLCKKFKLDVMIEDDFLQVIDIANKSEDTKIFLFDKNNQYTWNKKRPLPKNTKKIESWKDVEREIEKLTNKRTTGK